MFPDNAVRKLALFGLMLLCLILYFPGLNSLFLFDDAPNLRALEYIHGLGPGDEGFWQFVMSGGAGPLGRPVSLFTFALQADYWPDNPAPFKWAGLAIHLLNGFLVFSLTGILSRLAGLKGRKQLWTSTLTTALWLLHPAHTSTVLYTVQRMTLLSSTFMLAALLGYLKLRVRYFASWKRAGFFIGLAGCVVLAMLGLMSKENAGSLLFFVLALEYTLLDRMRTNAFLKKARPLLWLPVAFLVLLYVWNLSGIQASLIARFDYGTVERVLTESRILWFQVLHTFLPGQGSTGLFIHFDASSGLTQPITTLFSVLLWLSVFLLALGYRRQAPVAAFAVFWFLAGHVIESTVLPLELFFNHRNYLAMLGPLFLLVWGLLKVTEIPGQKISPMLIKALPVLMTLLFSVQLGLTSRLWSQPLELASVWYSANPDEPRNEEFFAIQLAQQGRFEEAIGIYDDIISRDNSQLWPHLSRLTLACSLPQIATLDNTALLDTLNQERKIEKSLLTPIRQLNELVLSGQCPVASQIPMEQLLTKSQQGLSDEDRGFVQYELARFYLAGELDKAALILMESAYELTRDPGILYNQANLLITRGDEAQALPLIEEGLRQVEIDNRIDSGTRAMKRQALNAMRDYLLENNP